MTFPGSRVIDPRWSAHHRPVAVGTMTARCTIDRDGDGAPVWDDETGTWTKPDRVVLYTDMPCRVQQQKQPQEASTGGEEVTTHDYLVPVPVSVVGVKVGHQVLVDACPDDLSLVGRRLTVTDVQRGSLVWERDLICIDWLG